MRFKQFLEKTVPLLSWVCGIVLLAVITTVLGFLFLRGWQSLNLQLLFGTTPALDALLFKRRVFDGLFPAMVGTFSLVCLAVCWAIPVGIAAGVYLAEYAQGKTRKFFNLIFDRATFLSRDQCRTGKKYKNTDAHCQSQEFTHTIAP